MTSKPVALLLADLGVTKTHARPHVSNDNPFSEAQFKTLKYRPAFPTRFGAIQDARAHCHVFFPLVQHRAPSLGPRPAHACRRTSRRGRAARSRAGPRARHGLRRAPGTLPRRTASPAGASRGSVDQPTQDPSDRGGAPTLISRTHCLILVALAFTNRVGALAEAEGHHPALLTEWGRVTVTWWTHKIRGLHRNDFIMAAKTDGLARSRPGLLPPAGGHIVR